MFLPTGILPPPCVSSAAAATTVSILAFNPANTGTKMIGGGFIGSRAADSSTSNDPIDAPGVARAGIDRDVWIAIRKDGKAGSGTKSDPFDGSTWSKFDALMKGFGPNLDIHLLPGTFATAGADAFIVKAGWKIYGSGEGVTIIQLVTFNLASHVHGILGNSNDVDGVEVHDLTLDGNHSRLNVPDDHKDDSFCGAVIYGNDSLIENVETINLYGDGAKGLEEFSILTGGLNPQDVKSHCRIINCFTHHYAKGANYTNGLGIAYATGARILDSADDGGVHGIGIIGTGGLIDGCTTTTNTGTAFYSDTGEIDDLTISNCWLGAALIPFQWNNASPGKNIELVHNTLETANNSAPKNVTALYLSGSGVLSNFRIIGNTFIYTGAGNGVFLANFNSHANTLYAVDNIGVATQGGYVVLSYMTPEVANSNNYIGPNYLKDYVDFSFTGRKPIGALNATKGANVTSVTSSGSELAGTLEIVTSGETSGVISTLSLPIGLSYPHKAIMTLSPANPAAANLAAASTPYVTGTAGTLIINSSKTGMPPGAYLYNYIISGY
ncbi:MAG: hypothetical protein LV480_12395 [Methylacidiphilales bacterium]|nr:hypothetical protein [Candidatus Methylacidiphilales bacterium]